MAAINVYAPYGADTESNGLAIIHPISGTINTEENGTYDAEFTVAADPFGKYRYIREGAIVKIPLRYHGERRTQLFRIYSVDSTMDQSGSNRIKAKARHIFYDLTNSLLIDRRPTNLTGAEALRWILGGAYHNSAAGFSGSSDIVKPRTAYYQHLNITNALLGAENAFVNVWGGELYRDNYYFSINERMEGSRDTGVIRYAHNLKSISFVVDNSKCITWLVAEDNFGNRVEIGNEDVPSQEHPLHRYAYQEFRYDAEDPERLRADAQAYFNSHSEPDVSVKAAIADLDGTEQYKDFAALSNFEVGDRVIIYHSDLGISYKNLKIIGKKYDFVNEETTSIEIGSFRDAIFRESA